jgi:twinkle protein
MQMTDYIGQCLRSMKAFARTFNVTIFLVAHPTKAVNENGGRIPTLSDIEGSMHWNNKCDNGLIVHRDPEQNRARVISAKVREIGAGRRGVCWFNVDPKTGVFTPEVGAVQ